MIIRWKYLLGLVLSILVFTSSIPILFSVQTTPQDTFEGTGVIVLTNVQRAKPINSSIVSLIREMNYTVSPEIFMFASIQGTPVTVRGVEIDPFFRIERARLISGEMKEKDFLYIGSSLQRRTGLDVGDRMVIPGSSAASIYEGTITGVFCSPTPADDQIILPVDSVREMTGRSPETYHVARVLNGNLTAIVDALSAQNYSAVVGSGTHVVSTETNQTYEEEVAMNLMLRYSDDTTFQLTNASHIGMFAQRASSSIEVVILGFILLDGSLTFIGTSSILSRAIYDRRRDIGVLRAIGASDNKIRLLVLKELILISSVACIIGISAGYAILSLVSYYGIIVVFGQTMHPSLSMFGIFWMFAAMVAVSSAAGMFINEMMLRMTPSLLIGGVEVEPHHDTKESIEDVLGVDE